MTCPVNATIVIPMRNAERYIAHTLNTILAEHTVQIEVIVIDDQSTDKSVERVKSFCDSRIKILSGEGKGISSALNIGVLAANGEVIMRCDADDFYTPGRISQQYLWLSQHLEYGAVCGSFSTMDASGRFISKVTASVYEEDITQELSEGITRTSFCTFAVRANVLKALGGFRLFFETAEDIDFQLRLSGCTRIMYMPEVNYMYRLHDQSITHTQVNSRRQFFEDTARLFQHQRYMGHQDDLQKGCPPKSPQILNDKAKNAEEQIQEMLIGHAWELHAKGLKLKSLHVAWKALIRSPWRFRQYKSIIALVLKTAHKKA